MTSQLRTPFTLVWLLKLTAVLHSINLLRSSFQGKICGVRNFPPIKLVKICKSDRPNPLYLCVSNVKRYYQKKTMKKSQCVSFADFSLV